MVKKILYYFLSILLINGLLVINIQALTESQEFELYKQYRLLKNEKKDERIKEISKTKRVENNWAETFLLLNYSYGLDKTTGGIRINPSVSLGLDFNIQVLNQTMLGVGYSAISRTFETTTDIIYNAGTNDVPMFSSINNVSSNSKKDIDSAHENKVENAFVFGDDASEIQEFIEDISIFIPALVGEISLLIEDILNKLNLQDVVKHIGEDDDEHAIEVITDMIDEQLKEMVQHMSNKTYIYVSQCILGETPKTISFYKKPFVFLDTLHEEIKKYSVTKLTKMTMEELKVLKMI